MNNFQYFIVIILILLIFVLLFGIFNPRYFIYAKPKQDDKVINQNQGLFQLR